MSRYTILRTRPTNQIVHDLEFALDQVRSGANGAFAIQFDDGRVWRREAILKGLPEPNVEYVITYTVYDAVGNVYENEDLLLAGYDNPQPGEGWEPTSLFADAHVFQPGDIVTLERTIQRWQKSSVPGVRPIVRTVSTEIVKTWGLTWHRDPTKREWKELADDGDHS